MQKIRKLVVGAGALAKQLLIYVAYTPHRKVLAINPRHDDVYVVSFPKSGATWIDFLLANTNIIMSNIDREVTFYNVHHFVPDIHDSIDLSPVVLTFPGFRFIKSHSPYNPLYKNVIYVVRDPRDVLVSYYYFMKGLGGYSGSLSQLIRSEMYGISAWLKHVEGWIDNSPASLPFFMIKYEDLKLNAESELFKVYEQLGYVIPDSILSKAVEMSSFSNMKVAEKKLNYGGRPVTNNFKFMRKGVSGEGKDEISASDHEYIINHAGDMLSRLGYI